MPRCRGHRFNPNSVGHTLALSNNIIEPTLRTATATIDELYSNAQQVV